MSSAAELDWLQASVARGNEPRLSRRVDSESSSVASDGAHGHPDGNPNSGNVVTSKLEHYLNAMLF